MPEKNMLQNSLVPTQATFYPYDTRALALMTPNMLCKVKFSGYREPDTHETLMNAYFLLMVFANIQ